jgi:hypothetical protein
MAAEIGVAGHKTRDALRLQWFIGAGDTAARPEQDCCGLNIQTALLYAYEMVCKQCVP